MSTKAELTAPFTPAVWSALAAQGLAKIKLEMVGYPTLYTLSYPDLDNLVTRTLIEKPFTSRAELEAEGFTANDFIHDVIGIPDIPENTEPQGDFELSIAQGLAQVLKTRLSSTTGGGVQRRLNSHYGLWLVSFQPVNVEGGKGLTRYGATNNPELIGELHIQPAMKRQVNMQTNATVTALTIAHRVPETAARIIAAQDTRLAAEMAARQRTYGVLTTGMSAQEKAELDAAIANHGEIYKQLSQLTFQAIENASASIPDGDSQGSSATDTSAA